MNQLILKPEPLTQAAFKPFGDVIEVNSTTTGATPLMINNGNTERYDQLARVECLGENASAAINIFRAQPRSLPMRINMMERHPLGSQSFHPLSGEAYLVLVANPIEQPTMHDLKLFLAQPNQGINYATNTWHHPVLALNTVSDFLVVDRKGDGHNCEEYFFADNEHIEINV